MDTCLKCDKQAVLDDGGYCETCEHGWSCECHVCLGTDFDRYHHSIAQTDWQFAQE